MRDLFHPPNRLIQDKSGKQQHLADDRGSNSYFGNCKEEYSQEKYGGGYRDDEEVGKEEQIRELVEIKQAQGKSSQLSGYRHRGDGPDLVEQPVLGTPQLIQLGLEINDPEYGKVRKLETYFHDQVRIKDQENKTGNRQRIENVDPKIERTRYDNKAEHRGRAQNGR